MSNNYSKAYVEVLEILKYIPREDLEKVPKDIIYTLENCADKEYIFKINKSVPFEEQNLMEETKDILANFFRDYWATDFQREQILIKEKQDEYELEKNKIKINYDELFKNKKIEEKPKTELTVIPEKKWYEKFLDYMKKIFKFKRDWGMFPGIWGRSSNPFFK